MSVPGSGSAQYIIDHYHLGSIGAAKHQQTVITLITNGLYYQQVNNPISALVSFSSAASYIYALKESATTNKRSYDTTLNIILGHVEALQQKTQMIGTSDKKDDEDVSWAKECINMCETKSNSLCLTFADVIGMTKEKNTMVTSIIKPLVYPNLFTKSAKGVLLYGPPGTGKTYLVKALVRQLQIEYADSAQVLFFPLTGADLKGKYVGETEKKIVRAYTCAARRACQATDPFNEDSVCTTKDANKVLKNLSESASQKIGKSPQYVSVIFIDEFDSIGGDRSNDDTGLVANSVNTLLQMMDGIVSFKNIITVAATNYPWSLDPALLRRFNEHIYCTVPSINHIKQLVEMEMKQRFEIQKKNQRDYCAVDIDSKVFKPSQELAKFVGQKKEKGGCGPSVEERIKNAQWPLNIIDRRYMAMDSPEAEALIVYMKTENYSNSDIASVVQKAYNIASEACINDGTWFRITPGAKSFIEEATTELANLEKGGAETSQIKLAKSRLEVLKAKAAEELAREAYVNQIQQLGQLIAIPIINTTKDQHNPNYALEVKRYEDMLASIQKDKKQLAILKVAAAAEAEKMAEETAQATGGGGGGGGGGGTVATPRRDAFVEAEKKFASSYRISEKEIYLSLVEAIHKYNCPSSQTFKTVEEKILTDVSLDEHELSRRIKQLYEEQFLSLRAPAPPPASAERTAFFAAAKAANVQASENLAAANKAVTDAEAALDNIKKQYWATSARKAAAVADQQAVIAAAQRAIEPLREELAAAADGLRAATEAMPADPEETKKYKASLDKFLKPLPPYKQGIIEKDVLPACDAYLQAVSKSVIANSTYILDAIPSAQSLQMDQREEVGTKVRAILQKPRRPDITDMLSDFAYAVAEFGCMNLSRQDIKLTEVPKHYAAALEKAATLAKGDDNSACQYKIAYLRLVEEKDKLAKLIDKRETDTADIDAQIRPITDEIEIHTKILNILGGTYTAVSADPTLVKEMQEFFTSKIVADHDASAPAKFAAATAAELAATTAYYSADTYVEEVKSMAKGLKAKQEPIAKAAKARTAEALEAATTTRERAGEVLTALVERLHSDQDFLNKVVHHNTIKDQLTSKKKALDASKALITEYGLSTDGPLDYWEVKQRFYREKYLYEQRVAANTEEFVAKTKEYIYYDLLVSVMKPTAFKNSIQKSEEYFISKMTKIIKDVDPNTYNLIDSAATQLDKQAKQDSIYDNGHTESKLQVPPTVIIDMFGGSSKNIFGNTKKTRMITSINFYSKKYINSKLIKDLPAELIFKDDSIADIFFTESDVKTYRATKSNIDAHKNTFINIMFTRVISVMNDNAAAVILPKKHGITDTFEKITGHLEIFNAKEVLGTNEAVTLITLLEPLIEYDPEIKVAHDALVGVRGMPVEFLYGTKMQEAKTEAFKKWIRIYQDYFSTYDQQKIVEVAIAYYTEKKRAIDVLFSGKINGSKTEDDCFAIDKVISSLFIFANNFADCIDDITKEELTEAQQHYGPFKQREQTGPYQFETVEVCTGVTYDDTMTLKITNSVDHIIQTLTDRQIDAFKVSENGDPAKTVKKVFFFLAKIRPFGAAWTQFKAGGLQWSDGVGSTVSGWWQRFRSTWSTAAKAAHIQTITDNEIRAEIAKNKRTVADYLLLRTTHVGICNGENDSTFYEIADEEIKDQKLCPEIPEEDDEEDVSLASASTSASTSVPSESEAKAIEYYKAARQAAIVLQTGSPGFARAVKGRKPDDQAQESLNTFKSTGPKERGGLRKNAITLWQQAIRQLTFDELKKDGLGPHITTLRNGVVPRTGQGGGTRKNYRARANITRRIGGARAAPDPVARNKTGEKGVDDSQPQNIMWFVIPLERTSIDLKLVPRHLAISLFGRVWLPADEKEPYWPNLVIAAMFMNDNFIVNKLSSDFSNFSESFNINYHKAVVQRSSYINKVLNTLNFKLIRYDSKYEVGSWYGYIPYIVAAWGVNSASSKYFGKSIVMCVFDGIKSATGTIHDYFIPPLLPPIVEPPASANPIVAAGALAAPTFEFAPGQEPEVLEAANAALPVLKHRAAEAAAAQIASAANSQIVDLAGARGLKAAEEVAEKLSAVNAALTAAAGGAKDAALAILPTEASINADITKAQENFGVAQAAVQAFRSNTGEKGATEALEKLQKVADSNLLELGNLQAAKLLRTNMDQLVSSVIDKMKGWIEEPPPVPAPPPTAAAAIVATDPYAMYKAATALGLDAFVLSGLYTQDAINHFTRAASLNDMLLRAYIELETELKIPAKDMKRNNIKRWLDKYNTVKWDNLSSEEKKSYAPFEDCTLLAQAGAGWSQEQYDSSATSGAHEEDEEEYEEYEEYKEDEEEDMMDDEEDMIDNEEDMMDDEDDAAQNGGSKAPPGSREPPPGITPKPPPGPPPEGQPRVVGLGSGNGLTSGIPQNPRLPAGQRKAKGQGLTLPPGVGTGRKAITGSSEAAAGSSEAAAGSSEATSGSSAAAGGPLPLPASGSQSSSLLPAWKGRLPPAVRAPPPPTPPAQGITQAGQAPHGHGAASSPEHSPLSERPSEPAGALSHGSGAASSGVVPSPPLTGSQPAPSAPLGFGTTSSASAPPSVPAPPPPPPPVRGFNKGEYIAKCNELEMIFKKPSITKGDICHAYDVFCDGALAAGTGGITLDIKGKYMLILIKFIAKAIPQKAKADMPKMDSVSSSLYNKIISPFAKVALITAVTTYGIPATVTALKLTVGVGPLWAAGGFLLDVAIKLHEAEGFRISQMSALERDIMNYLKTNAPSNYVQINIKEVVQSGLIDRTKCLNFYMDPGFLKAAADSYPSTWNKENGIKFAEYDTNRAQFMSKEAAARDARKNR